MTLNDLITKHGIDAREVLVLRHRPAERELRKVLPWLAAERPDVFNAYQQTQGPYVERAMTRARFVASFIGHQPGKALFVGMYEIRGSRRMTRREFWRVPAYVEMKAFGMRGFAEQDARSSLLWFDLDLLDFHSEWKGKLIVRWTPPERAWWRRAHRNDLDVLAILEDSALDTHVPAWDEINLSWPELAALLPKRWAAKLSEWRGIYHIFDTSDAKGYVGSAYGAENLLGRWRGYAATGHGGN